MTAAIKPAVEVRERHGHRRGAKERDRCRRRAVETTPQREQVERHPLGLRDVRVIGGVRQMKRGERVGQRGDGRARRREREMTREQVGRSGGQGKAEKDEPVVRGHRTGDAREQRAGDVGDRLRIHADG